MTNLGSFKPLLCLSPRLRLTCHKIVNGDGEHRHDQNVDEEEELDTVPVIPSPDASAEEEAVATQPIWSY